jgi:hypothetical protein
MLKLRIQEMPEQVVATRLKPPFSETPGASGAWGQIPKPLTPKIMEARCKMM